MKYNLMYDYAEGAHPSIIEAMLTTNMVQQLGYSDDEYCSEAAGMIKKALNCKDADIHFVSGGTQANMIVLSSVLKPYESIISAHTGHISVHEAGAIESSGHKINEVITDDGKLNCTQIEGVLANHTDEHMVIPRMVYISNATELGNIYNKAEIEALSEFCRSRKLLFYMDGARLGTALASKFQDLKIEEICDYFDAFYIGGTKNGALLGEALVLVNDDLKKNFRHSIKQKGGLLAKGRIMGLQFRELFRDELFFKLAKHANNMAFLLADGIEKKGYKFIAKPETNMIFPIFQEEIIKNLEKKYLFYRWKKISGDRTVIRLVTSWATSENEIKGFIDLL